MMFLQRAQYSGIYHIGVGPPVSSDKAAKNHVENVDDYMDKQLLCIPIQGFIITMHILEYWLVFGDKLLINMYKLQECLYFFSWI